MPFIRYTYPADVAVHGSEPVEVPEVSAKVLTERRRAEVVPAPVAEVCDGCDDDGLACEGCEQ